MVLAGTPSVTTLTGFLAAPPRRTWNGSLTSALLQSVGRKESTS